MFKRLLLEDASTVCVIIALFTAVTIFTAILWRAVRMPRTQVARLQNLPFDQATPATRHEANS